ncbi:MAG: hypothetical protein L3J74_13530, partial [Bacteroidales bacterium]|nr:hypothetical protein [Bacteroidales bacterium]
DKNFFYPKINGIYADFHFAKFIFGAHLISLLASCSELLNVQRTSKRLIGRTFECPTGFKAF